MIEDEARYQSAARVRVVEEGLPLGDSRGGPDRGGRAQFLRRWSR